MWKETAFQGMQLKVSCTLSSTEITLEISCGRITLNPNIDVRSIDLEYLLTFKAASLLVWKTQKPY